MFFHILLGLFNGFLDGQSVQRQITVRSYIRTRRVADDTFLGIEAFFVYVTTFYQRADFESEMLGESIVAAIVGGYGHDGSCSVSCQYVIADPDGHCFTCKRIDSIRTAEYTGHAAVGDAFAFRTFLGAVKVGVYFCFLGGSGQLGYRSLSGARTMKVTPNMVSARVVKMVNSRSLSFTLNCTSAPSERPIQFF